MPVRVLKFADESIKFLDQDCDLYYYGFIDPSVNGQYSYIDNYLFDGGSPVKCSLSWNTLLPFEVINGLVLLVQIRVQPGPTLSNKINTLAQNFAVFWLNLCLDLKTCMIVCYRFGHPVSIQLSSTYETEIRSMISAQFEKFINDSE